jgi:hypothetical protein
MFHTLTELIFISLFAATLSLAFDNLFNSALQCTRYSTSSRFTLPPAVIGTAGSEGSLANSICEQQVGLIIIIFLSVLLYIAVLVVSLFRIFAKVSRK